MERLQAAIEKARAQRGDRPAPPRPPAAATAARPDPRDTRLDLEWQSLREIDSSAPAFKTGIAALNGGANAVAFDMLRTRVIQQARTHGWKRIAIVSPHSGCGKTTTAANLGFSLSRNSDLRTLVMDLDLRRASLGPLLGQTVEHTMADVLEGKVDFAEHALRYGTTLAFGLNSRTVANSAELLQSNRAGAALDAIDAAFQPDLVLYDMPPLLATDDSVAFLKHVDCALMIVAAEETPMNQIDVCERQIAELTQVMGVVLNKCRMTGSAYGYDYSAY